MNDISPLLSHTETSPESTNDTFCAICHDDMVKGNRQILYQCLHKFHPQCIQPWLEKQFNCPTCRRDVEDYHIELAPSYAAEVKKSWSFLAACLGFIPAIVNLFKPNDSPARHQIIEEFD